MASLNLPALGCCYSSATVFLTRSRSNNCSRRINIACSWNTPDIPKFEDFSRKAVACTLAVACLVNANQQDALAQSLVPHSTSNLCQIAALQADGILKLDSATDAMNGETPPFVMGGMTAKDFNPARYAGRWFEVASLKRGFAGSGQEDCHCTQGVYTFDEQNKSIQVDTFCVHGSPDGYITGIRGFVRCISDAEVSAAETEEERQEMIASKCFLKFPFLPFIPKEPYDVIGTDYDNFALVSGAKDKSFVQIYSRTPNPGPEFISKYKDYLATIGYNAKQIKDTPQDCEDMSMGQLQAMMSMPGMQEALINKFPDLKLQRPVQLNPFTSIFDTLKKLLELYFK